MAMTDLMREIKHEFMVYRNGIVADTLRKAGDNHNIIFGLQLPVLKQIAIGLKNRLTETELTELAHALWADSAVRESRLLTPLILTPANIDLNTATKMCQEIITPEEADILIFALLRHTPWLQQLHDTQTDPDILRAIRRFLPRTE